LWLRAKAGKVEAGIKGAKRKGAGDILSQLKGKPMELLLF
jgi:hypothetical protein